MGVTRSYKDVACSELGRKDDRLPRTDGCFTLGITPCRTGRFLSHSLGFVSAAVPNEGDE